MQWVENKAYLEIVVESYDVAMAAGDALENCDFIPDLGGGSVGWGEKTG